MEAQNGFAIAARTHGATWLIWRTGYLAINEETLEIRAVEGALATATGPEEPVETSNVGDAPMLPKFLDQIDLNPEIATVTADSTVGTRKCRNAIADCGTAAFRRAKGPSDQILILSNCRPAESPDHRNQRPPAPEPGTRC